MNAATKPAAAGSSGFMPLLRAIIKLSSVHTTTQAP